MNGFKQLPAFQGIKKDVLFLLLSGIGLLLDIAAPNLLPFHAAWIAIFFCGLPIILEAMIGLVTVCDIKADMLVSLALIASIIIGEYFAAGEIAFIMQLGGLLEELTVAKAKEGIEKLVHLTPQIARVLIDSREHIVPAEQVQVGNILRVLPGETIPVDGIIVEGQTSVNQAVMTGESLPVDKSTGDPISSGTINQFGTFTMKATKVGEDSSIRRMIRLVQSADAEKTEIVRLADRWATWIVIIALTAAAGTFFVTHEILRSVTILVVFCPCAMVLATPTAIMAAIGNVTRHGFLVREGDALERLSMVSKIAFDKTGTLTYGTPRVISVKSIDDNISYQELYRLTACGEKMSEHPLGKAITRCYEDDISEKHFDPGEKERKGEVRFGILTAPERFTMLPGRGIFAEIEGKSLLAGNRQLFAENNIDISEIEKSALSDLEKGATIIFIAINRSPAGYIALADTLREKVSGVITAIEGENVSPVLLTGDGEKAARHIAYQVGIRKFEHSCLPEDKLSYIRKSQDLGHKVCMVGDGINDAPALKTAYVGIAMGGVGSDIAIDAADIVLVQDDIRELPHLLAVSRQMMRTIKRNLTFSMALNFAAILLAITGILNPIAGALVHNAGSICVVIHSVLLLKWKN